MNTNPLLELSKLYFEYHDTLFLHEISFSLLAGELLHIQGTNGRGKTTLLRLIAGLYEANSGTIQINGLCLIEDPVAYKKQFCFVSHKTGLNPCLTVREALFFDLNNKKSKQTVLDKLAQFNLESLANLRCAHLSAGQQRRVALTRLLLSEAQLWLLDEPFVALDEKSIHLLATAINQHRMQGGGVVLTSHQSLPKLLDKYQEYPL